jgi:hypothetical protein
MLSIPPCRIGEPAGRRFALRGGRHGFDEDSDERGKTVEYEHKGHSAASPTSGDGL